MVREYVVRQLAPVLSRLNALERFPMPERGERGERGEDGPAGPTGRDGATGRDGRDGKDGKDGKDGEDGRDGSNGADGFGFDDLSVTYDGERRITLRFQKGNRAREFPIDLPVPIDRGVWRAGELSQRGDGKSHGGSFWIAQRDTQARPEEGEDWRLAVKRGRDGRDGKDGEKGETGSTGRAGRDLTQMGADGSKW
jgi:integrin beta 3